MKKKILLLLSVFLLWGCQKEQVAQKTLKQHVTLSFFYLETCAECKAFKKQGISYLEGMYGESLTINQYDLDASETKDKYHEVIDSLVDFDEEHYGQGPFYALEGYFAKLGYTAGDEEELARDIEKAVNHEELGYELEALRYMYKDYQ